MRNISCIIKDYWHNKSLVNGSLFSIFSFINKGFNFVLLLLLANYFTPSEYGYLSLFVTIVMLLGYFKALSTEGYMSVAYFKEGESGIKKSLSCVFATSTFFLIISLVVLVIFSTILSQILDLSIRILVIALFTTFFTLYSNVILDYIRIREKVVLYGAISCGSAFINVLLTLVLVICLNCGWEGRVLSMLTCSILVGGASLIWLFSHNYIGMPQKEYWVSMLTWGIPLIPHLGSSFLRQGCDRYIINSSHGIEEVGYFSFALTLSTIITMIGYGFNQSNSVEIYKILGDTCSTNIEKKIKLSKQRKMMFIVYSVTTIMVVIGCLVVVPIILPNYNNSIKYFPFLAFYSWEVCIYLIYTNYLFFYKETKQLMYITLTSACLHLLLSLIFTKYSLYCTCTLYCITQFIVVALVSRKVRKLILNKL